MNRAWEEIDSGATATEQAAHAGASREQTTKGVPAITAPRRDQEYDSMANGANWNGSKTWVLNVLRWVAEVAVLAIGLTIWAWSLKTDQLIQANKFDSYKEQQSQNERERRLRELAGDRKHDELIDAFNDLREELVAKGVIDPRRSRRMITNSAVREGD